MSRRRYISSAISDDKVVARVEKKYGDFAGLLYDRMIPHAEDDATITGDAEELLAIVFPHRRDKSVEDVVTALEGIEAEKLIAWDRESEIIYFPIASFYKYQAYIAKDKRRVWDYPNKPIVENGGNNNQSAEIGGNNNSGAHHGDNDSNSLKSDSIDNKLAMIGGNNFSSAENGARARTPSVSVSSSVTLKEEIPPIPPAGVSAAVAATGGFNSPERFKEFWAAYPRKVGKDGALRKFKTLVRTQATFEAVMAGLGRSKASAQWLKDDGQFIPHPSTWLHQGRWKDEGDSPPGTPAIPILSGPGPIVSRPYVSQFAQPLRAPGTTH